MILFVWNIVLALLWAATTEDFDPPNLIAGFVLGFLLLLLLRPALGDSTYFRDVRELLALNWFFLRELVIANFKMAYWTVMPLDRMRPGIIAVPLEPMSDIELTVLSNLITLTPGTLAMDVTPDRRTIYVHVMWYDDPEAVRQEIKRGFETQVIRGLR